MFTAKIINKKTLRSLITSVAQNIIAEEPIFHDDGPYPCLMGTQLVCYSRVVTAGDTRYKMGVMGYFAVYEDNGVRRCETDDLSLSVWRDGEEMSSRIPAALGIQAEDIFEALHIAIQRVARKSTFNIK